MQQKLNRKLTLILLFLSYSFILGHSIFPHHHQEEDVLTNTSLFHSTEDHRHSEDFKLPDVFNNYYHPGEKELYTINHFPLLLYSSKSKYGTFAYKFDLLINDRSSPPYILLSQEKSIANFKKILFSYSGYRAPPLS